MPQTVSSSEISLHCPSAEHQILLPSREEDKMIYLQAIADTLKTIKQKT
jgi:hypothetical protein